MNKTVLLVALLIVVLAGGLFVYPSLQAVETARVSEVSDNPSKYLGELHMEGIVGATFEQEGGFIMTDTTACCQVTIFVPFTEEQKAGTNIPVQGLYKGSLPSTGQDVRAVGTLKREGTGYFFDVDKIVVDGQNILVRAN